MKKQLCGDCIAGRVVTFKLLYWNPWHLQMVGSRFPNHFETYLRQVLEFPPPTGFPIYKPWKGHLEGVPEPDP